MQEMNAVQDLIIIQMLSEVEYSIDQKKVIGGTGRILLDRMMQHNKEAVDYLSRVLVILHLYKDEPTSTDKLKARIELAKKVLLMEAENNAHLKDNLHAILLRAEHEKASKVLVLAGDCVKLFFPNLFPATPAKEKNDEASVKAKGALEASAPKAITFSAAAPLNNSLSEKMLRIKEQIIALLRITDKSDEFKILQELFDEFIRQDAECQSNKAAVQEDIIKKLSKIKTKLELFQAYVSQQTDIHISNIRLGFSDPNQSGLRQDNLLEAVEECFQKIARHLFMKNEKQISSEIIKEMFPEDMGAVAKLILKKCPYMIEDAQGGFHFKYQLLCDYVTTTFIANAKITKP